MDIAGYANYKLSESRREYRGYLLERLRRYTEFKGNLSDKEGQLERLELLRFMREERFGIPEIFAGLCLLKRLNNKEGEMLYEMVKEIIEVLEIANGANDGRSGGLVEFFEERVEEKLS